MKWWGLLRHIVSRSSRMFDIVETFPLKNTELALAHGPSSPPADLLPPATFGPAKHRSGTLPASILHPSRSSTPFSPALSPLGSSNRALLLYQSRSRAGRSAWALRLEKAPPSLSPPRRAGQSLALGGGTPRSPFSRVGTACSAAPGGDVVVLGAPPLACGVAVVAVSRIFGSRRGGVVQVGVLRRSWRCPGHAGGRADARGGRFAALVSGGWSCCS
ncbi:hypothetical protein ZWY2020_029347 [Hordeum vulgare]|nr:hypothetical protein ZWY2020_029347 [Hordeum vulgare]